MPARVLRTMALASALAAALPFQASSFTPDGINLGIQLGPKPLEVTLHWIGGQAPFEVFRSSDPTRVVDPANRLGETFDASWVDQPPPASVLYYVVTSPCVYDPPERCDGIDNDCDGVVPADEADADRDGVRVCAGDCDDADPASFPGATERCDNRDNDCDGFTDGFDTTCGIGQCAATGTCEGGVDSCVPGPPGAEICDGIDNDCDGEVDEDLCPLGCNAARGQCNECDPADPYVCAGGTAVVCGTAPPDDGRILSTERCAYGCETAQPSNFCFHPDTCTTAFRVRGPDFGPATFSDDMSHYNPNVAGSCGAAGSDVVHQVEIPPAGDLTQFATIIMDSSGSSIDTASHITTACGDPARELVYSSRPCGAASGAGRTCANTPGGAEILRACGMPAGAYFATLDSSVATGAFTLNLAVDGVNLDTCAEAGNISNTPSTPTTVIWSTTGKSNDYLFDLTSSALTACLTSQRNACGLPNGSPDGNFVCGSDGGALAEDIVFYYQALASGFLTLDTQGSSFDTVLYMKNGCNLNCTAPSDCLACNDDNNFSAGASWSKLYCRPVTAGVLYNIVVDGFGGEDGRVQLNVRFSASGCP